MADASPQDVRAQAGPMMTVEQFRARNPSVGYLKIQALGAGGVIPISQVRILVYKVFPETRALFYDGRTDMDGITPDIPLPAPPRSGSTNAGDPQAGSQYFIHAAHPNYLPREYQVEIFEGVTSILPVMLQPLEGRF